MTKEIIEGIEVTFKGKRHAFTFEYNGEKFICDGLTEAVGGIFKESAKDASRQHAKGAILALKNSC